MKTPEYSLQQAIALYEMALHRYRAHVDGGCAQCVGWFAKGPHCEEGHSLMLNSNKWIRRMKRVAALEGVELTLPTPIREEIS